MSVLGSIAGAAATALFQRTFLMQMDTAFGVPILLVVLDTVDEEDPEYSADVTQHPVEKGPEVSDHIQLHNPELRLKGKISNTPLDLSVSIANLAAGGFQAITSSQARSNLLNSGLQQGAGIAGGALMGKSSSLGQGLAGATDAIVRTALLAAFQNKTPFDVFTKRQRYENMVIQKIRFPRTKDTGYALDYEIDMIHLEIVSPLLVQLTQLDESVIGSASPSSNLGSQSTSAVSSQTSSKVGGSWLRSIVGG